MLENCPNQRANAAWSSKFLRHHRVQPGDRRWGNFARIGLRFQLRIAVAILVLQAAEHVIAIMRDEFAVRRRAKADRIGHAIIADGDAIMRNARRQIKNVARFEKPFVDRLEVREDTQIVMWQELARGIASAADLPAAPAQALNEKHVVMVEMRAHAAAIDRIAHHHIVDPPIRNESKRGNERGNLRHQVIDRLHQQGPGLLAQPAKPRFRQRAMFDFPTVTRAGARMRNQARFDAFFTGEAGELIR